MCQAFHTVPNIPLPVLSKVLPIVFVLQLELASFVLFVCRKSIALDIITFLPEDVDYPVDMWFIHQPKHVDILFDLFYNFDSYEHGFRVYTDTSLCVLG